MRPIALARVRLHGGGLNICGVSAQTFVSREAAQRGDQTQGVVDHMTLLDDGLVLFEREGRQPELVSVHAVATLVPLDEEQLDLLPQGFHLERAFRVSAKQFQERVEAEARNAEAVARNTDVANCKPAVPAPEPLPDVLPPPAFDPFVPAAPQPEPAPKRTTKRTRKRA